MLAARANRLAGELAGLTPASQVADLIARIPQALEAPSRRPATGRAPSPLFLSLPRIREPCFNPPRHDHSPGLHPLLLLPIADRGPARRPRDDEDPAPPAHRGLGAARGRPGPDVLPPGHRGPDVRDGGGDDRVRRHLRSGQEGRQPARPWDMLPELRGLLDNGQDRLRRALEFSIVGNYMDCAGAQGNSTGRRSCGAWTRTWTRTHTKPFPRPPLQARDILILGRQRGRDRAGHPCWWKPLLDRGCRVTYAVRGRPVINDATLEGRPGRGHRPSSVRWCPRAWTRPGTVVERCDPRVPGTHGPGRPDREQGARATSKPCAASGPGVWFAFKVKCPVVAKMTGRPVGHSMFCTRPEG